MGITGELTAVVGISGNKIVGCNYEDVTDPPDPLVPIGGEDDSLACTGPFLADLNDATCSYAQDDDKLAFDVLGDSLSSRSIYTRECVSFSDLDVFADTDPNGDAWPQWILDNRDELYDEGKTSYPCIKKMKKGKKWKNNKVAKATRAPRGGRRKRTSRGDTLVGI